MTALQSELKIHGHSSCPSQNTFESVFCEKFTGHISAISKELNDHLTKSQPVERLEFNEDDMLDKYSKLLSTDHQSIITSIVHNSIGEELKTIITKFTSSHSLTAADTKTLLVEIFGLYNIPLKASPSKRHDSTARTFIPETPPRSFTERISDIVKSRKNPRPASSGSDRHQQIKSPRFMEASTSRRRTPSIDLDADAPSLMEWQIITFKYASTKSSKKTPREILARKSTGRICHPEDCTSGSSHRNSRT